MVEAQIKEHISQSKFFFTEGHTRDYIKRRDALLSLLKTIKKYENGIIDALHKDLGKPTFEGYISDLGVIYNEIRHHLSNLKKWMKPVAITTPIEIQPASSRILYSPKGLCLIMAPWNYPINLAFLPLVGAISAGNCAIVKPAHETPHCAQAIQKVIEEAFDPLHVKCILGEGHILGPIFLNEDNFDHVFFTGSPKVGQWVLQKCAHFMTPVTLELGGKNPAIIDETADINLAARRIMWSKLFNVGQTCIAVDFVLIHNSLKASFIEACKKVLKEWLPDALIQFPDYGRIINQSRILRLIALLEDTIIHVGGLYNIEEKFFEPTIVEALSEDSPILKEEIFGPLLLLRTFADEATLWDILHKNQNALSCYVFSENSKFINTIFEKFNFGNGALNDCMSQFANSSLPFGGTKWSGWGRYHGYSSYKTFSQEKSILYTSSLMEHPLKYLPYSKWKEKLVRFILK